VSGIEGDSDSPVLLGIPLAICALEKSHIGPTYDIKSLPGGLIWPIE
jgi:hypothetical protein